MSCWGWCASRKASPLACWSRWDRHTTDPDPSVLPAKWLATVASVLAPLGAEIRRTHGREPDTGDLLLVLACLPGLPAGNALQALDIDPDKLTAAVQGKRRSQTPVALDPQTSREIRRVLALPAAD
jgi:hypothetical protein